MADKTLTSISFEGFGIPDKYIVRNISRFSGRRISIIGDSIETFSGYIPNGYVTYYPNAELGITSVDDCWWKKVIDASNAKLEINASYSGGRVTNTGSGPSFYNRTSIIGSPDAIFVTSGVNDSYYNIPLGDYDFDTAYTSLSEATFRTAYIKGVKALKALYPNADIICIAKIMSDEYKNSIRKIADTLSVDFIDASNYNAPYSTGVHPDKLGMNQIASSMMYLSTLNIGYDNETVKVTPQTFTEEQKAQARENIGATSGGLIDDVKQALLNCFAKVGWIDDEGQSYYDALESALYVDSIDHITAVLSLGTYQVIMGDDIDSLRDYLTVTVCYQDETHKATTNYELTGDISTEGTKTITVTVGRKNTTFTVPVVWGYRLKPGADGLLIGGLFHNYGSYRPEYFDTDNTIRISNKDFLPWESGYDCYIEADTQLSINISVNVYNQAAMNSVANHQNISSSDISLPGWKSNPSLVTVPDTFNSSPVKDIRITCKTVPSETTFTTPDVISEMRITRRSKS